MADANLDGEFVARQKERLEELKQELKETKRSAEESGLERSQEGQDSQLDAGDLSQHMFERELGATIGGQAEYRLGEAERALEKIEEGTYGLSDESGEPIPQGRLEALPEAIRTVEEQQRFEKERRPI